MTAPPFLPLDHLEVVSLDSVWISVFLSITLETPSLPCGISSSLDPKSSCLLASSLVFISAYILVSSEKGSVG